MNPVKLLPTNSQFILVIAIIRILGDPGGKIGKKRLQLVAIRGRFWYCSGIGRLGCVARPLIWEMSAL